MLRRFALQIVVLFWCAVPASGQVATFDNSEVARQCRNKAHLINLFTVGGRPMNFDAGHKVKILVNQGFAVGYSEERRCPLWAVYKASKVVGDAAPLRYERSKFFAADTRAVPAVNGRTFGGGFDRGHMVPNSVIASQYGSLAQMETFFMTNMCPQKAALNRGPWARLEKWIIDAAQEKEHIFVVCGPIFGEEPKFVESGAERKIQIPDAYFMILVDAEAEFRDKPTIRLLAYVFPQDAAQNADFKDREKFGASVDEIEEATQLDFFPEFSRLFANWDQKEAAKEMTHWTLE